MDYYEEMKKYARYIDAGMKTLNECARTSNYQLISPNEDEKLMNDINDSIISIKKETDKLSFQANKLNGLNDFVSTTSYTIQELKRIGNSLGMFFRSSNQNEFSVKTGIEYNMQSNFQQQQQQQLQQQDFRNEPLLNMQAPTNPNLQAPKLYDYSPMPIFREITNDEYQTLPPVVPLLVKLEDMNRHYQKLMSSINNEAFTVSSEEMSEIIQLSSSRINAFIRALVSLNRMKAIEGAETTMYKML